MALQRAMPVVGAHVTIAFLAVTRAGTIVEVAEEGRRLEVLLEDGGRMTFALSRATGRFTEDGRQTGARLTFGEPA
jgi:hypothetical protein